MPTRATDHDWPLIILAVCSVFVGWTVWIGLPFGTPVLEKMLEPASPLGVIDAIGPTGSPWAARW